MHDPILTNESSILQPGNYIAIIINDRTASTLWEVVSWVDTMS